MKIEERIKLLERENSLLNGIIQDASDSIYAKDLEGRYITINQKGAEYLGCTIDEVIGKTDEELIGEYGKEIAQRDNLLFETGKNTVYESSLLIAGQTSFFRTSKSPLRDQQGKIIGLVGVSRNITATRHIERKYQFIFDNAPVAFWEEDFSEVKTYFDELREQGILNIRRHFERNPEALNECIKKIKVLNVNKATLEMNGAVDKSAFTKQIRQNFTPESESVFIDEFEVLFNGEKIFQAEGSFVNLRGETLDVVFNVGVLPGHEQTLSMVIVSVVDITDSRRMASELSNIRHRYQSIVEAQTEMICRVDVKGNIIFQNAAFANFFNFKHAGLNHRFVTLFPPDELERCNNEINKLSATEQEVVLELRNYDAQGNVVWQEWSIKAFFGNSGILLGYQAVGSDVTRRKMAQEALAASEARWRSIFEHANDWIFTLNNDGYILSINDFQGLPKGEKFAGRTIEEVLNTADALKIRDLLNSVVIHAQPIKTELEIDLNNDGVRTMFGMSMSPISYGKRVISVICIGRDITDMKRLEKQTKEALIEGQENERMRVSQELHDGLGQLFTAIKLNLQQIRAGMSENVDANLSDGIDQLESNIEVAFNEVRNISRNLMPDVLWQFGLQPAVKDLVEKCNAAYDAQINVEFVDVGRRFSKELEKALFRMCQELINNAVRHAGCSTIFVQIINHGDSLVLSVEDDGVGFDTKTVSNGFGLQNIRSRAEVFGGVVDIDSSPDSGTVTTIEIPLNSSTEHDPSTDNR